MLSKKTIKLFFGKYVYKVAVTLPVASTFRGNNLSLVKEQLDILRERFINRGTALIQLSIWQRNTASLNDVDRALAIVDVLKTLSSYTLRVESCTLGMYSNDSDFLDKMQAISGIYIEEISKPADTTTKEFLLSTPKAIIRNEYTHKYKVTITGLWDSADNFKTWAAKLPKIKTTNNRYKYGGFFYVADEKTLSLCHIFLADKIRKVEELVSVTEI